MRIGITNLKGGVGKTTLSINCAVCFAHMGYKVGLIDTDTNQNSVNWYDARDEDRPKIEVWSYNAQDKLAEKINGLYTTNDIVIIDGTPNLDQITTRIMMASDILIIPIRPSANDYRALSKFYERFLSVKEVRPSLPACFLLNEYDDRYLLHRSVRATLEQSYQDIPILKAVLKSRTAYGESILNGEGVLESTDLLARAEITALTSEILQLAETHSLIK